MAQTNLSGLPSLRYRSNVATATKWAEGWRRRWFRYVGSVHQHYATGELVAFYSNQRDPAIRLALQRELEARRNGIGQVLAVCRREIREWNAGIQFSRLAS